MFPNFSTFGLRVWGAFIAAGAVLVGFFSLFSKAKQSGREEVASKVNSESAAATKRMLDAAVAAPKEVKDVQNDLRSGKF